MTSGPKLSKANRVHIQSSCRKRECDVSEGTATQLQLHKLKWHVISAASRHSALSLLTSMTHTHAFYSVVI